MLHILKYIIIRVTIGNLRANQNVNDYNKLTCSGMVSTIGVLMKPGQIALTRIPNFPSSFAADLVKPITPAFEAE